MKHFKKLNAKGFGHVELLVIIATIAVIGGIGSYVMLKRSHADVTAYSICGSNFSTVYAKQENTYMKLVVLSNGTMPYPTNLCAVTIARGTAYGVAKPMSVKISLQNPCTKQTVYSAGDSGNYKFYAGPRTIRYASNLSCPGSTYGVPGTVHAAATMTYKGVGYKLAF